MSKKLVIVESPAKAHTINKILGKEYTVRASMGHVRDLPLRRMGVDIQNDFAAEYQIIPSRKETVRELRAAAKKADEVFLATDLDREGEAIAWHLAEALSLKSDRTRRVVFNEITPSAIKQAFAHPRPIDMSKVNAQQARRILDRIVGYRLSPLLWRNVSKGLSAGRVQSVAVKLIVDREREIQNFVKEEYWRITATLSPRAPRPDEPAEFEAELKKLDGEPVNIPNEALARELVSELSKADYVVSNVTRKERVQPPPPPFITSTLQQQASIRLGFSPKRTMALAQQLYEGVELGPEGAVGLITYMRTDSVRVAEEALAACRELILQRYGKELLPEKPNRFRQRSGAQAAHEAIRPTVVARTPEQVKPYLKPDQFKLYELIWQRFVASQMNPAIYAVTDVEITAGRGLFTAQGKKLLFPGYTVVTGAELKEDQNGEKKEEDKPLPSLEVGQPLNLLALTPTQHFTQPPPRYTEATLVRTLERLGIGRPSTYAPIISTILDRHYVRRERRQLIPTELGMHVTDLLVKHFPDLINVNFTSEMEKHLDQIEEARRDWVAVLREFYGPFSQDLERASEEMKNLKKETSVTDQKCEKCGKPMVIRWSKRGKFLGCSGFPQCRFILPLEETTEGNAPGASKSEEAPMEASEEPPPPPPKCEKCGRDMVLRSGPRGKFYGCSGYPECRHTRPLEGERPASIPEPTDIKCEKCGKPMVIRTGRRGRFLGCSGYPECRNAKNLPTDSATTPNQPTDVMCDKCGKPMVIRQSRRGSFLGCSGYPECRNTKPLEKLQADTP